MLAETGESTFQYAAPEERSGAVKVLVFRTDITNKVLLDKAGLILDDISAVKRWKVDFHDIDKVLRVEAFSDISLTIIQKLTGAGILCMELPD